MTTRIDLIPSPFDRLDPVARAVRWWTTQMIFVFGAPPGRPVTAEILGQRKRIPSRAAVLLAGTDAFVARLTLPKGSPGAHRRALELRLNEFAPVDAEKLEIAATAVDQAESGAVTYAIAMSRRNRLNELEIAARRKGASRVGFLPEELTAIDLKSTRKKAAERRALILNSVLVGAILAAAVAAVTFWTARVEAETVALVERERGLRRAAIAYETTRRDAELARDFINRGVLDRRAGVVLSALSELNEATPAGAWWTRARWSPTEVTISAEANDAAKAIEAISASAKSWTAELSGPVNSGADSTVQNFELKLRPKGNSQ